MWKFNEPRCMGRGRCSAAQAPTERAMLQSINRQMTGANDACYAGSSPSFVRQQTGSLSFPVCIRHLQTLLPLAAEDRLLRRTVAFENRLIELNFLPSQQMPRS